MKKELKKIKSLVDFGQPSQLKPENVLPAKRLDGSTNTDLADIVTVYEAMKKKGDTAVFDNNEDAYRLAQMFRRNKFGVTQRTVSGGSSVTLDVDR